jgi:hypothetical protein
MLEERSGHSTTPEGLIVKESVLGEGIVMVEEIGHFDYVIYKYKKRPMDNHFIEKAILKLIEEKGLKTMFELMEESPSGDEPEESNGIQSSESTESALYAIDEEETGPVFLAERILDLQRRCDDLSRHNPISIDLAKWRYNRKAAKRRLRRLIREEGSSSVVAPQEYHELIRKTIQEIPDAPPIYDTQWCDQMLYEEGEIDELREYWRRKSERVVIIVHKLPREISLLMEEASEAYFRGLFRATAALCRAMLEDVLRRVAKARITDGGPTPIFDDNLSVLINCMPSSLLGRDEKKRAHNIRERGNDAVHEPDSKFSESESWQLLTDTCGLIEHVINHGGLGH